jgi:hypothetical protein
MIEEFFETVVGVLNLDVGHLPPRTSWAFSVGDPIAIVAYRIHLVGEQGIDLGSWAKSVPTLEVASRPR